MPGAIDRLESLVVRDLMNPEVVQINASDSIREAAAQMANRKIAAAPVVDEQGRCVGVLSATDFVKRESGFCGNEGSPGAERHGLAQRGRHDSWQIEAAPDDRVSTFMTTAVQTVSANAPLMSAARMMNAQHLHRLIVLDEHEKPAGIISTMDVVAALVNAVDEVNAQV